MDSRNEFGAHPVGMNSMNSMEETQGKPTRGKLTRNQQVAVKGKKTPFDDSLSQPPTIVAQDLEDNSFGTVRKSNVALKGSKRLSDDCRLESLDYPQPGSRLGKPDLNDI